MSSLGCQYILGLGSNLGKKEEYIHKALKAIELIPKTKLLEVSLAVDSDPVAGNGESTRKFKVRVAITDDGAAFAVHRYLAEVFLDKAGMGFAALTAIIGQVGADEDRIKFNALTAE